METKAGSKTARYHAFRNEHPDRAFILATGDVRKKKQVIRRFLPERPDPFPRRTTWLLAAQDGGLYGIYQSKQAFKQDFDLEKRVLDAVPGGGRHVAAQTVRWT